MSRRRDEVEVVWRGDTWRTFAPPPAAPVVAPLAPRGPAVRCRTKVVTVITGDWVTVDQIAHRAGISQTSVRRWLPTLLHLGTIEMRQVPSPQGGTPLAEYRRR